MNDDLSFLARPGQLADWRMVLVTNNAVRSGLLDALPGSVDELSAATHLHPKSTRILLDALIVYHVVEDAGDGTYRPGPAMPDRPQRKALAQHAQFILRWANELPDRLSDPVNHDRRPWVRSGLAAWLGALGARARLQAPALIDRCLAAFPEASTVLDVAGGHGEYGMEAARRGLQVTVLDLPAVIEIVADWPPVQDSGVALYAADVFDGGPPAATFDLVLAFGFTHTQPPARTARLFPILAGLTNPGGGLAVNTFLRGDGPVARLFAVQMLIAGNDGDTHRLADYQHWITDAGYDAPLVERHDDRALLLAAKPNSA